MANRSLLHRSKLEAFKSWLGSYALPPVGKWEVLRWKNRSGQPMCIVFDNAHSSEHLSCNDAATPFVRDFIIYQELKDKNINLNSKILVEGRLI